MVVKMQDDIARVTVQGMHCEGVRPMIRARRICVIFVKLILSPQEIPLAFPDYQRLQLKI